MKRLPAMAGPIGATVPFPRSRDRGFPWRLLWRAGICLVGAFFVCCAIGAYVGWTLTHPARKPLDASPSGFNSRDVQFQSVVDHLVLSGWFLDASSDRTVIMVHGYRDNRLQGNVPGLDVARGLVDHGYNFLTFDLRDAGRSDGSAPRDEREWHQALVVGRSREDAKAPEQRCRDQDDRSAGPAGSVVGHRPIVAAGPAATTARLGPAVSPARGPRWLGDLPRSPPRCGLA